MAETDNQTDVACEFAPIMDERTATVARQVTPWRGDRRCVTRDGGICGRRGADAAAPELPGATAAL